MLLKDNDPTKLELAVYDKDGNQVAIGTVGTTDASVTNLQPGTTISDGIYKVAFTDGKDVGPKVSAPGVVVPDGSTPSGTDTGSTTGSGTDNGSGSSTGTGSDSGSGTTTPPSNAAGSATTGTALAG